MPAVSSQQSADSRQQMVSIVIPTYCVGTWIVDGRKAGKEPLQSPHQPSSARSRRASCACQPCHQDRKSQAAREGSRQLFRDVTLHHCPGSSARLGRDLHYSTFPTHNPIFKPLHCLERARPEPWSPSSLGFYHLCSLLGFHPPVIQPAIVTTLRRIGTGKTGRDRARWSGPGPVSDHAPVRKKMRRLAGYCSAVPRRGCSLAVWQSGTLVWHFGGLKHGPWQNAPYVPKTMMPGFTSLTSREATMSAGQQLVACMAGDQGEPDYTVGTYIPSCAFADAAQVACC